MAGDVRQAFINAMVRDIPEETFNKLAQAVADGSPNVLKLGKEKRAVFSYDPTSPLPQPSNPRVSERWKPALTKKLIRERERASLKSVTPGTRSIRDILGF